MTNNYLSPSTSVEHLSFSPPRGLGSPHLQTILPILIRKREKEPPTFPLIVRLEDGDSLYCKMSTPLTWTPDEKTVIFLHGLGGSDSASYMIRMSRKFYQEGYRTLRVNLRGCGAGSLLAQKPYHGGTSRDILQIIRTLKKEMPESPIILMGFSLGGNIALKLMGELEEKASSLIELAVAICAPIDLSQTMQLLCKGGNHLYHQYYVKGLKKMGSRWIGKNRIKSITNFDNLVTAPLWGFADAHDYYRQCSSKLFLTGIRSKCHLIFAADDPFVDYRAALEKPLSTEVKIWLSPKGGHMGFFGWAGKEHRYHWLDFFLLNLVNHESSKRNALSLG